MKILNCLSNLKSLLSYSSINIVYVTARDLIQTNHRFWVSTNCIQYTKLRLNLKIIRSFHAKMLYGGTLKSVRPPILSPIHWI